MITIPPQLLQQGQAEQGLMAPAPAAQKPDPSMMMMAAADMHNDGSLAKYDDRTGQLGPPLDHAAHARHRALGGRRGNGSNGHQAGASWRMS